MVEHVSSKTLNAPRQSAGIQSIRQLRPYSVQLLKLQGPLLIPPGPSQPTVLIVNHHPQEMSLTLICEAMQWWAICILRTD